MNQRGGMSVVIARWLGNESVCYPDRMSPAASKLLDQAMSLSEEERLSLATDLIASIDGPPEAGWDEAWALELERRATAAAERGTPAPEWREVRARILQRLAAK